MKTKSNDIIMQNKVFIWIAFTTGLLLLIPLIGMQFSNEVDWTLFDFIIGGILLFGTGFTFVLATRRTKKHRALVGIVLFIALLLIWAELAVGIFGTPFAGS